MIETDNIYNGDCMRLIRDIPDGAVNLVVTDPPYLVNNKEGKGYWGQQAGKITNQLDDLNITDGYNIRAMAQEIRRVQNDNINAYFFCNAKQIPEYIDVYVNGLKCGMNILCWHKRNVMPLYSNTYLNDTEYIMFFHKGKGHCFPQCYEDARSWLVGNTNKVDKERYLHPTIKPQLILRKLIRNSSREGEVVLDPFVGSGSTCVAARDLGRKYIGFELSEKYYNIARRRVFKPKTE